MRAPPTYRERLRVEGLALAALGVAAGVVVLALEAGARHGVPTTIGQLAGVAVLLLVLGPLSVRRALAGAEPVSTSTAGSGEPTPLWHLPLVVLVLATPLALLGRADAVLRLCLGCVLVGLAQAVLLADIVGRTERATGRVFVRLKGSRIGRGTRVGWWAHEGG